jgi:hypothetical protein
MQCRALFSGAVRFSRATFASVMLSFSPRHSSALSAKAVPVLVHLLIERREADILGSPYRLIDAANRIEPTLFFFPMILCSRLVQHVSSEYDSDLA